MRGWIGQRLEAGGFVAPVSGSVVAVLMLPTSLFEKSVLLALESVALFAAVGWRLGVVIDLAQFVRS